MFKESGQSPIKLRALGTCIPNQGAKYAPSPHYANCSVSQKVAKWKELTNVLHCSCFLIFVGSHLVALAIKGYAIKSDLD